MQLIKYYNIIKQSLQYNKIQQSYNYKHNNNSIKII